MFLKPYKTNPIIWTHLLARRREERGQGRVSPLEGLHWLWYWFVCATAKLEKKNALVEQHLIYSVRRLGGYIYFTHCHPFHRTNLCKSLSLILLTEGEIEPQVYQASNILRRARVSERQTRGQELISLIFSARRSGYYRNSKSGIEVWEIWRLSLPYLIPLLNLTYAVVCQLLV